MSWRDDSAKVSIKLGGKTRTVIGGSFRGVPFLVEQSNTSGGRRVATHEALPYGNERDGAAWNEDVGRVPRSVSVTAYLVGDDYMDQKVALQEALEGYGPAALVDPWNGTYPAASCTNYSISESRDDGGYCQISMDFSIADPETLQKSVCKTSDSVQETAAARSKLRDVACAAFAVAKSTVGYPNDVAGKVLDATNEVLDGVAAIRDFVRDIAAFEDTLAAICVNLRILWSTPDILASDVAMLFDSGENLSSAYADILTSIVQQPAPELEVHGPETPQTIGAKKDARAFSAFVSRLALAELGLVLVSEERDSSERAPGRRGILLQAGRGGHCRNDRPGPDGRAAGAGRRRLRGGGRRRLLAARGPGGHRARRREPAGAAPGLRPRRRRHAGGDPRAESLDPPSRLPRGGAEGGNRGGVALFHVTPTPNLFTGRKGPIFLYSRKPAWRTFAHLADMRYKKPQCKIFIGALLRTETPLKRPN